jgi:hypothetical protein
MKGVSPDVSGHIKSNRQSSRAGYSYVQKKGKHLIFRFTDYFNVQLKGTIQSPSGKVFSKMSRNKGVACVQCPEIGEHDLSLKNVPKRGSEILYRVRNLRMAVTEIVNMSTAPIRVNGATFGPQILGNYNMSRKMG